MNTNVGTLDRVVRAALGLVLLYLAFFGGLQLMEAAVWRWGAGAVGLVMLATAAFRFCPLYRLIGLKTCREC